MPLPATLPNPDIERLRALLSNQAGSPQGLLGSMQPAAPGMFGNGSPTTQVAPPPQPAMPQPMPQRGGGMFGSMGARPMAQPMQGPAPSPLGGSMRHPFNYDEAMKAILPPEPQHSKTHNTLMTVLDVAAAAMAGAAGQPYTSGLAAQRKERSKRSYEANTLVQGWKHGDWQNQNEADLKAADPFTIGRDRLAYNPATGQTDNLFHGPADWEAFTASKGLTPGTPEYFKAVDDYVLRTAGPSAMENFSALDDHRTENDKSLENLQSRNRTGLESLRQTGSSSLETQRQTGRSGLETQRQTGRTNLRGLPTYRDTHGGGTRTGAVPTATGPNGQKLQYVGGKWVPLK